MSVYGIIGDTDASVRLIQATLTDRFNHHAMEYAAAESQGAEIEPFMIVAGMRRRTDVYEAIFEWAVRHEVYVELHVAAPEKFATYQEAGLVDEIVESPNYMLAVVERCFEIESSDAKIYALVGAANTPSTDVARAIVRARDSGMEVRDLAEGGLTYITTPDNPIPTDTHEGDHGTMAEETDAEYTLAELGEIADDVEHEESADARTLLEDTARENDIDPDSIATYSELADALTEAGVGATEETEPPAKASAATKKGGASPRAAKEAPSEWTQDELEKKSVPELRELAKAAGVEDYARARSATLIAALMGVAEDGDAPAAAKPSKPRAVAEAVDSGDVPDEVVEALGTLVAWFKSL